MDLELSQDLAIDALTRQFTAEIAQRAQTVLGRAGDQIARLQAALDEERQRREQAESLLRQRTEQLQALEDALLSERQSRQAAEAEVGRIHAAIAEQLQIAEQEQALIEVAEAERQQMLESLREELSQERLRRERLQRRVDALRSAAADLFALDPSLPDARDVGTTSDGCSTPVPVILG